MGSWWLARAAAMICKRCLLRTPQTVTAPAAQFPNEHLVLCARVQAAAGGWGVKFDSRQLETPDSPKLAALLERVASEPSFKSAAAAISALLRAHPRAPVEQAAGGSGLQLCACVGGC
jgi:hypothetical protein